MTWAKEGQTTSVGLRTPTRYFSLNAVRLFSGSPVGARKDAGLTCVGPRHQGLKPLAILGGPVGASKDWVVRGVLAQRTRG